MKNTFFLLLISFFSFTSCISDEESARQVNSGFQGNWFGTFSGDQSGTVLFVVEKEGTIVGEIEIATANIKKEIKGYVNFSGKFDMNTDNGFKFSGYLAGNKSNGTWTTHNQQGQFTFQKNKNEKKTSLFLLYFSIIIVAQEKPRDQEVKNSIFNVQAGFAGIWLNNEAKIVNNLVLRSEVGLSAGLWGGDYYDNTGFLMTPLLHLEPRYYYNINRRISKQKSINNNSGNFFSLKTTFHPNWFVISNYDNLKIISDFSVIPSYGFRRNISQHLNYEFCAGLGYRHLYLKDAGYTANKSELAPDLTLRLGYTF